MVIVPEMLAWLGNRVGADPGARRTAFARARRGEGVVIEAHPRLFLYSAVERLRQGRASRMDPALVDSVAGYKGKGAQAEAARSRVHGALTSDTSWMGRTPRRLVTSELPALLATDHAFDAWLAALTAWAHENGETWTWRDARLSEEEVEVEGHILILKTDQA